MLKVIGPDEELDSLIGIMKIAQMAVDRDEELRRAYCDYQDCYKCIIRSLCHENWNEIVVCMTDRGSDYCID